MKRLALYLALVLIIATPIVALASDTTTAEYKGTVVVSNNGTAATNVVTVFTANVTAFQDADYINASCNNTAILSSAAADIPYMPGYAGNPWCLWVPSITDHGALSDTLYTGGDISLDGEILYFPDSAGMAIDDAAGMEVSDNGSVVISAMIDTTAPAPITASHEVYDIGVTNPANIYDNDWDTYAEYDDASAHAEKDIMQWDLSDNAHRQVEFKHFAYSAATRTSRLYYATDNTSWTLLDEKDGDGWSTGNETAVFRYLKWTSESSVAASNEVRLAMLDISGIPLIGKNDALGINIDTASQLNAVIDGTSLISSAITSSNHTVTLTRDTPFNSLGIDSTSDPITPVTDNLTLNLPLWQDDCSSSPFTSIDSNALTATVSGATWTNQGYDFNAAGSNYISIAAGSPSASLSIGAWVKQDNPTGGSQFIFYSATDGQWGIFQESSVLYFDSARSGGGAISYAFTDLGWHYYTFTHNHITGERRAYVDATPVGNDAVGTNITEFTPYLGKRGSLNQNYFDGIIGEAHAYDKVLTPTEITQNYNATKSKYTSGDIYTDSSLTAVPNTASDWVIGSDATPYIEYYKHYVGGSLVSDISWEYATTFTDASGNSNDATPTFRTTTTDEDVTASLTNFRPLSTAIAPDYAVTEAPLFITANITATGNFTSGVVPASTGLPGSDVVDAAATAGDTPNIWLWGLLAIFTLALIGLGISALVRNQGGGQGELIFRIVIACIVLGLLITWGKFDWWMLVFYLPIALAFAMMSRHIEWGGSVSQHGLIGFLAMTWMGLTLINRILEGQFITANERVWVNYFAFTQEFKVFDIFSMPILNFSFFTHGIPSLIKWEYSFFGGNAQLIQYMLYSITAVVSFIIFMYLIGLLYNAFRAR